MTVIHDRNFFREALRFAKASGGGARESFRDCIAQLNRIKRNRGEVLHLSPDFCKHSLNFWLTRDGWPTFNGGMILHGSGEETFAVELVAKSEPHWSIHT